MNFHLFVHYIYYPLSGLGDYIKSFNSQEEALEYVSSSPDFKNTWGVRVSIIESTPTGLLQVILEDYDILFPSTEEEPVIQIKETPETFSEFDTFDL